MNRQEHILTIIAEEAAEVVQAVTKTLRFGLYEVYPATGETNIHRLLTEMEELSAVFAMLKCECLTKEETAAIHKKKWERVEHYLEYSKKCGTLESEGA